jgi:cytochrome c peroxidase
MRTQTISTALFGLMAYSVLLLIGTSDFAFAQTGQSQSTAWAAAAIAHAHRMSQFRDTGHGTQQTPPFIPGFALYPNSEGAVAIYQPGGPTITSRNPFFQNLGTNGRTCFTCHQPQTGWTISAESAQSRFDQNGVNDPLFRLVDGATCPNDDISTPAAQRAAFSLLTSKGLIRIGLPMPSPTEFEVTSVSDPYNCNTNPATGLTSKTTGIVSVYRRPLPSTNLGFLSTIMWDGREPSLEHQALDATLGHAQGNPPGPSSKQQAQIVAFESGVFTAQLFDNDAHWLLAPPSTLSLTIPIPNSSPLQCTSASVAKTGGPFAIANLLPDFFIGINEPLNQNPCGTVFTSNIFDLYDNWANLPGTDPQSDHRKSVARGEVVFNTKPINITGVAGLNDLPGMPTTIPGTCGTCHDTPNVGNHSVKAPLNIGIADASPPALDNSDLPVFTLKCDSGPLAGQTFTTTDPGRALITGNCADIGKVKGPILRGLEARSPYFHNGSAAALEDVVNFYDQRFTIGFTDQEKQDLVNFLKTL